MTDSQVDVLRDRLSYAPKINQAYSSIAMKLTLGREKVLNFFGIRTLGSWDTYPLESFTLANKKGKEKEYRGFWLYDKFKKLLTMVVNRLSWRRLMQNIVNKYLPYKKYKLPEGLPISKDRLSEDLVFLKTLEKRKHER